ncbi:MAG: hypothetical protein E7018_01255 [Alphaproteobacteria bacterium]|nr:hypothetical protein [Alphaproteobacteria bacterium]
MPVKKKLSYETILDELEEARSIALRNESPTAAISASLGKAKVMALLGDKKDKSADTESYKQIMVEFV